MTAGGFGGPQLSSENHFAECLEEVLDTGGDAARARGRAAKQSAAWRLLAPEWRGLLIALLDAGEGGSSATIVTAGRPTARGGRRGGMRSRRGWKQAEQVERLEPPKSLVSSTQTDAYRLTGLLLQRHRQGEDWNTEWNRSITELRAACTGTGVHPIWPRLGREFGEVLGELALLEAVEPETTALDPDWLRLARIDPLNPDALSEFISPPIPADLPARIASPLQELHSQMRKRTKPRWLAGKLSRGAGKEVLAQRSGAAGLLAAMLAAASEQEEALERFIELGEELELSELAHDHALLLRIRAGDADVWDSCRGMTGDDGLSSACRMAAWSTEPPASIELSAEEIETGLAELMAADCEPDDMVGLRWRLVLAQRDAGEFASAMVEVIELDIVEALHVDICLSLLESDDTGTLLERLEDSMSRLPVDSLPTIIRHQGSPASLALAASEQLRAVDESLWSSVADELLGPLVACAAIGPLATLLSTMDRGGQQHPLLVLLVHQLLPADVPADILDWLESAHADAQQAHDIEGQHPLLSELSRSLILQLDGSHVESAAVFERLDKKGLKAYKQCRYALSEGGRGHIGLKEFSDLSHSIQNADLDLLEKHLFEVVLTELRLGWAIHERDSHGIERKRQAELVIDDLIRNDGRHKLLGQIHRMVLEHGLASPALVEWHEMHSSDSFWSALAKASMHEQEGEHELAARAFEKAASATSAVILPDNFDSDLQLRSSLQKEALKNYAHAACWSEAVRLLESIDNLVANIKRVFDLFLRASEAADRGNLNPATQMVMEHARDEVRQNGDDIDVKLLLEELHQLLSYPSELKLPEDPFRGRVLVAINTIRSGHRRSPTSNESRFRRALQERDVPLVGELARQAADEQGVENGLLVYERAMNSSRFSDAHVRQLTDMMKGLFSRHDSEIPIRRRMHLSRLKLKALVLMDTNLLIDALRDRLLARAHTAEHPPSVESRLAFHHTLLYRMQQGRIDLTVPAAARNELRNFIGDETRTRALLGKRKVSESRWKEMVQAGDIEQMAEQLITEYSNWHTPAGEQFNQNVHDRRDELLEFMSTSLSNVYHGIDEDKRIRGFGGSKRTEIGGVEIYPERGDLDIMLLAAELVERADPAHGSVLVASRDSDFCIPGRALQERFGFGIVDNARSLSRWVL